MTLKDLFQRALAEFDQRVRQVDDHQWHAPTPCTEWDVHALVNHVVNETRWIPPLIRGKTIEEVGGAFDGDLLGERPKAAWKDAAEEAVSAVREEGALARTVQVSYGAVAAERYITEVTTDIVIHSWDLARAIGADEQLAPELVDFAYATLEPQVEQWRAAGAFAGAVELPAQADRQTELLALTGRRA